MTHLPGQDWIMYVQNTMEIWQKLQLKIFFFLHSIFIFNHQLHIRWWYVSNVFIQFQTRLLMTIKIFLCLSMKQHSIVKNSQNLSSIHKENVFFFLVVILFDSINIQHICMANCLGFLFCVLFLIQKETQWTVDPAQHIVVTFDNEIVR